MNSRELILEIYKRLLERYSKQDWWPSESRFEVIVGAILTQNTNWRNVEKAIENLKNANILTAEKMYQCDSQTLAELIRPSGYYNIKTKRIKNFLKWLFENYDGEIEALEPLETSYLKEELLSINGIGNETADSILLYGLEKPTFIVDSYTARMLGRHGLIDSYCGYDDIKELFEGNLDKDAKLYNEYHALIVTLGKEHCKKRPICDGCPLESLPHEIEEYF